MNNLEMPQPLKPGDASLARGVIIGLLIVVIVILFGALYLWGSMLSTQDDPSLTPPLNNEPETPRAAADIQIFKTVSGSDEISAIEADLESTSLEQLDAELPLIENDLRQTQ